MVVPLVVAGLGGLALSTGANLYSQYNSRKLYSRQVNAYSRALKGYSDYLGSHGRRINPTRAYLTYGRFADTAQTNYQNSIVGSIGTAGGAFGAGTMLTKRWL